MRVRAPRSPIRSEPSSRTSRHELGADVLLRFLSALEIAPAPACAGRTNERSLNPHALRDRINGEGVLVPEHDVGVFADFERARAALETERPRGVRGDPADRLLFG